MKNGGQTRQSTVPELPEEGIGVRTCGEGDLRVLLDKLPGPLLRQGFRGRIHEESSLVRR